MRLDRYRTHFRRKVIPASYSGRSHVIFFAVLEALVLVALGTYVAWTLWTPVIVLASFAWATTSLYFLHRFLLHRPVPGFGWAHKMHHWHHTFYQAHAMQYDSLDDVYMLLMPPWIQLSYYVIYLPLVAAACAIVFPSAVVLQVVWALAAWYGLYEAVHWIEHLPDSHRLMSFAWARAMKRHHVVHHHPRLKDSTNFGIVEPSQDFLWGTKA